MELYHVKRNLFGIRAGTVERFAPHKAGGFLKDGSIEPYDEKKHGDLPGAPGVIAEATRRRDAAEAAAAAKRAPSGPPSHKQLTQAPAQK